MFRSLPIDSNKREDRSKEEVHASLLVFAVTCAIIRFVPIIVRKIIS